MTQTDAVTDGPDTIASMTRFYAKETPQAGAFSFQGRDTSYAELDMLSNRGAQALKSSGLKRGDRVAYLGKNSDIYFELLVAVTKLGAVMSPVNWRLAAPEVIYVLNDCRARLLFFGAEFSGMVDKVKPSLEHVEAIFGMEGAEGDYPGYPAWRDGFDAEDPMVEMADDDDALQLYTSGTTGHPKGAVLTYSSLASSHNSGEDKMDWQKTVPDEVSLLAMPCFHISGTGSGVLSILEGANAIVLPEYDPTQALELIENFKISKMFLVPAAIQILLDHPRANEVDFSDLQYITYGASPIPLELMKRAMDIVGCGFVQMYGMTETSGTIVTLNPEDHDVNGNERMRSVGTPLPGVEIKIIDENGDTVPPRTVGEIATRSAKNMKCYWNRPEATAETIDADGWLRTGDAGYMDEDGYLFIHDRMKDMIISGGENVYPAEVENAIYSNPKVADVAVIGIPDKKWGEAVKACVVVKEGEELSEADVIAHARENIAGYKCPKSVDFIDALPRNPSGKILRKDLRAPYWEGKERAVN